MPDNLPTVPRPDRRIERTRDSLRVALVALLAEKPWEDIAVQDICDRAGIGRSTFYLHYPHKDALLAAGLDNLRALLTVTGTPFGFIDGLVAHVEEQRQVFRSIIGRRSGHAVQRLFRDMVERLVKADLAGLPQPATVRDLTARYIAGGMVEALALWIETPGRLSAGDIVDFLREIGKRAAASG